MHFKRKKPQQQRYKRLDRSPHGYASEGFVKKVKLGIK
jgi:hypothetical protein